MSENKIEEEITKNWNSRILIIENDKWLKERNHKVKEDKPKDGNKKRKRKRTQIMKIKNENKKKRKEEIPKDKKLNKRRV